jgi:catechol 2,3-dioxygenase-like lactoylglutathione lyase family enzyme
MPVELNHTIVLCRDQEKSATFWAEFLGRPAPTRFSVFHVVALDNGASLDFHSVEAAFMPTHYAFLVSESDYDQIFGRIKARGLTYWADPAKAQPGKTYRHNGGRGFYFEDPDGHFLEVLTKPYGSHGDFVAA